MFGGRVAEKIAQDVTKNVMERIVEHNQKNEAKIEKEMEERLNRLELDIIDRMKPFILKTVQEALNEHNKISMGERD